MHGFRHAPSGRVVESSRCATPKTLLNTSSVSFVDEAIEGAGSFRIGTHELFVPAVSVDTESEKTSIEEDIKYQEGFLNSVRKKLGNERFVNNAKPEIVEKERQKEADALAKLAVLKEQLARL